MSAAAGVLAELTAVLAGRRIRGGCDDCCAYQVLRQHSQRLFVLEVHHDNSCPFLRRLGGAA